MDKKDTLEDVVKNSKTPLQSATETFIQIYRLEAGIIEGTQDPVTLVRVTNTEKVNPRELAQYGNPQAPCIIAEYGGEDARDDCGDEKIIKGGFPPSDKLLTFPLTQDNFRVHYIPNTVRYRSASE